MREYDVYVPREYNDGKPVEPAKLDALKAELRERFGGVTHLEQAIDGEWRAGRCVFKDELGILRVVTDRKPETREFFAGLRERLKRELRQDDVMIVARDVEIVGG